MRRMVLITLALFALLGGVAGLSESGWAQTDDDRELSAQIVARVVDGSRTEFGLRIGERTLLPRSRFLSRTVTRDNWRASSEIVIADGRTLFVIARQLADGRTELGLRVDGVDGDILPRLRFMPAQSSARSLAEQQCGADSLSGDAANSDCAVGATARARQQPQLRVDG